MSWHRVKIEIGGKAVSGYLSKEGIYSVPYDKSIKIGNIFTVSGERNIVESLTNHLNRNEQLLILGKKEANGKSKARRDGDNSGSKDLESEGDD